MSTATALDDRIPELLMQNGTGQALCQRLL